MELFLSTSCDPNIGNPDELFGLLERPASPRCWGTIFKTSTILTNLKEFRNNRPMSTSRSSVNETNYVTFLDNRMRFQEKYWHSLTSKSLT